ncbi:unnamed protein product [Trichobilharzia regenti]|nr:unnamed protein product [Trichobilharzia regenti]
MSISHSASPSYEENSVFNNTGRSKSVTGTEYLQANNNCFEEEEEWQSVSTYCCDLQFCLRLCA